jgi:rubrerythrin
MYSDFYMPKSFKELSEREMLSLAISQEEKDGKIYGEFAERMRPTYLKLRMPLQ